MLIDGSPLPPSAVAAIAARTESVELSDSARTRAAQSNAYAEQVSKERHVYGRSTGVGANRQVPVADPEAFAHALLRSHASAAGPERSPERIRAMLAVRLNQLAAGGSGVTPELLDRLAAMLVADALPPVREYGSIGTADLSALARTALALMGELPTSAPLPATLPFGPHDALPFLSSNAATIGDAALAHEALHRLARAALQVAALSFTAVDGNPEAFAPAAAAATPFPGAREVCRVLGELLPYPALPARIQDPFGLRALPQVHGAYLDALDRLGKVTSRYTAAPAENPVLLPDIGVAHHGGFHAAYLVQALDATVSAAAQSAQLALARLAMLVEPAYTGLEPFLSDGTPAASGVMVAEYIGASALAALRSLATPAAIQSVTISRGVEEDASFASLAAKQALDAVSPYRIVLACELLAAVRALRLRGVEPAGPVGKLPDNSADRDLTEDIDQACELLDELA
ncbi:aromatic amino acid lyase [Kitasatospora azatica]|uniref:aromatic amino acid lyase n=1 Tax=Kitasatospora azatica TaxID=58347 RepID=UPI00068EBF14|nr:aromatic amino acid lyase [Kitasatospora azatica]